MVIALSIMIFTATTSVLSGLRSAPASFAAGEGFVISEANAPTIFSSHVSMDMLPSLEAMENITGVSPEIFAFSSWNGHSFVLRGVDLERLNKTGPAFSKFELAAGGDPGAIDSALVGDRLLGRLGIHLPYTIPVVGSYSSKIHFLRIVGSFESNSPLDDELLITLGAARFLAGMPEGEVSVIRVSTSQPGWLSDLLSPQAARFALFDLQTSKAQVSKGEPLTVSVSVRNWGSEAGRATITYTELDRVLAEVAVELNASASETVQRTFVSEAVGSHSIQVTVSGELPVRLWANYSVVEPYLDVAAPSRVMLGQTFNVTVTEYTGQPASQSLVRFSFQTATADSQGKAMFTANATGEFEIIATLSGFSEGATSARVVDPSQFPHTFVPVITSFSISPTTTKSSEAVTGVVTVENDGTEAGSFDVVVYVDNLEILTRTVNLSGISSETFAFTLVGLDTGTRTLQVGPFARQLVVEPWFAENPDLVQFVIRFSGSSSLSTSASIPIYQAAKISQGNVAVSLFAVGAISALLAVLAVTSVFSKEIREGRRRLGVLRTIGASRSAIMGLVLPQALEKALAGAAVGIALGIIMADQLSRSGLFFLFGHKFVLEMNTGLLVLMLFGAVGISILSALASARVAIRESSIRSIKRLEEEPAEMPLAREFLED